MADFYPVISKAISGLQEQTPQSRRAIYDRARQVLVIQLRNVSPPIAETEITRQRLQLDDVINRIERDYLDVEDAEPSSAGPTLAETAGALAASDPPIPVIDERAPAKPVLVSEPLKVPRPSFASLLPKAEAKADATDDAGTAAGASPAMPDPAQAPSEVVAISDRPRVDISTPPASRAGTKRKLIVLGGVVLGLAAVGTAAFYINRDNRESPQTTVATPAPAQPQGGPKINERVGSEPAAVPGPAPASQLPPGSVPRGELAVAQRAVLYLEPSDQSQAPRAIVGRVSWRIEAQNTGQGQLLENVVRADVDISEVGLQLTFTLRRNMDAAFPASHILGMRFQRTSDDGNGAVREAGVPQFKQDENERGAPLSAITTGLGENLFVSALSRVPVEVERNIDLLRTRNWIDIPVRFASGKRGIIAFEKGLSGDQRIAEGLASWR